MLTSVPIFFFFLPLSVEKKEFCREFDVWTVTTTKHRSTKIGLFLIYTVIISEIQWLKCNIFIIYVFIFLSYVHFNSN